MKNIKSYYGKNQRNDYWRWYHSNGQLSHKGNYLNGKLIGYWIYYNENGKLKSKDFYL